MHDSVEPSARAVIRFATFEVDVAAGELRRQGVKTRLQEQPLKVLLLLLSRPGDVVTREELRAQLWPADTFVDFEHSLNAAVKRLRDALGDSADNPRFIETLPRRGYRFLLPVDDPARSAGASGPSVERAAVAAPPSSGLLVPRWALKLGLAVVFPVLLVAGGLNRWLSRSSSPLPAGAVLTRLTSDSGLTTYPAVSPDGQLLAYASDRSGEDNLDIWVQQLSGGEAIRLTRDAADDLEPAFSPDGTNIVFRSERNGGGIYVVSALGGEPRLIAHQGSRPRFSPDGKQIVYWTGSGGGFSRMATAVFGVGPQKPASGHSKIYVVAATGGPPTQLRPEFVAASSPVWSPDGKRILFWGHRDRSGSSEEQSDWWISPLAGGEAIKTGILAELRRHGLSGSTIPDLWVAGDRVLFSDRLGDTTNIWEIPLSAGSGGAAGAPQRLTFGTGLETQPSIAAGGRLVFSSHSSNIDIWSLPIAANEGRVTGDLQRLTRSAAFHVQPRLSANGKTLAFASIAASGKGDVWLKDLDGGKETALTVTPSNEEQPVVSADGSKVAYVLRDGGISPIYVVNARGGVPEKICEGCTLSLTDWSPDGTRMLYLWEHPRRSVLLNLESGRKTDLLRHPQHNLYDARFSADGQWITFLALIAPERRRLYVVRFRGDVPLAESEWVAVTDGRFSDDKPRFSPDGNLVYFISNRDGFICLWAQRLEPATKQPLGSAFVVHHFHGSLSIANVGLGWFGVAVAPDHIVFNPAELTGNIWMARTDQR